MVTLPVRQNKILLKGLRQLGAQASMKNSDFMINQLIFNILAFVCFWKLKFIKNRFLTIFRLLVRILVSMF